VRAAFEWSNPVATPLLTFVHLSDTHLPGRTGLTNDGMPHAHGNARAVIAQINALPYHLDFVLLTGDVGHDPVRETDYLAARSTLSQLRPKLHVICGEHDRPKWLHHVVMGRVPDTYYYTFEANGVQVACLDSTNGREEQGSLGDQQLAWLDKLATQPSDRPFVVAVHHHPVPLGAASGEAGLTDGAAMHQILLKARYRLRCVLFGHIHEAVNVIRDGITYASAHSTWYQLRSWHGQEAPVKDMVHMPGFNVVTLLDNGDTFIRSYRAKV
jgi:3',5'-cyclic-AMP phosphodiesterase